MKIELKETKKLAKDPRQGGNQKTTRTTSKTHKRKSPNGGKIFREGEREWEGERQTRGDPGSKNLRHL